MESQIHWRLGFVGAGVMAETMIAGALSAGGIEPERILASAPRAQRLQNLQDRFGIRTDTDNLAIARQADLLVLSVKPQTLAPVLKQLRGALRADGQVLSIVAGASLRAMRDALQHQAVARAMPNLPCRIHRGITVWTGAEGAAADRIRQVLCGMGSEIQVSTEADIDRATAINGTGPAIVAEFVKAMLEAAGYVGEPRKLARESVLATLLGTAEMIRESEQHVAGLIDEVTSPGGTTSRALQVLKDGRFGAVLTEAVDAAYRRTIELGEQLQTRLSEAE